MIGHLDVPRFDGPALCAETDPDAFFPDKGGTTRTAKKLCNGDATRQACPVRDECLAWALDRGERHGIWGGLSERERRRMRRLRRTTTTSPVPAVVAVPGTAPVSLREPGQQSPRPWTTREAREAIRSLTANGRSAAEIAGDLGISSRTVQRVRSQQRAQWGAA